MNTDDVDSPLALWSIGVTVGASLATILGSLLVMVQ